MWFGDKCVVYFKTVILLNNAHLKFNLEISIQIGSSENKKRSNSLVSSPLTKVNASFGNKLYFFKLRFYRVRGSKQDYCLYLGTKTEFEKPKFEGRQTL